MATPNINAGGNCIPNTALAVLTTTSATQLISNASASGKAFLVDSIQVGNVNSTTATDVTLSIFPNATNTGTPVRVPFTLTIPPKSSQILIGKENGFWLLENQSVYITAGAANNLEVLASWKEFA